MSLSVRPWRENAIACQAVAVVRGCSHLAASGPAVVSWRCQLTPSMRTVGITESLAGPAHSVDDDCSEPPTRAGCWLGCCCVWLPERMLRLTLDTNCVINAAQGGRHSEEIDQLVNLARSRDEGLWLTSAFEIDQKRAWDEKRRINLQWLGERPLIRQVPGPFRLDLSNFDGPDVLVSDEVAQADEKIKSILRPSYRIGVAIPSRKFNDIHHLTAHLMVGHDAFVTQDEDDMIKRRQALRNAVGIKVVTSTEAVVLAMGS